jgi:deoxyadenosine/deoxycytidine kinase
MIIWINGPFGVGKTTLADNLLQVMDNVTLFNPELIGKTLWNLTPVILHEQEFEDEPIWRKTTYQLIMDCYQQYKRTLVIPMTIAKDSGYSEIIDKLRKNGIELHMYTLLASGEEIKNRLLKRGETANSWEQQQIDRCLEALKGKKYSKHIDTTGLLPRQTAQLIFKEIQSNRK